MPTEPVKSRIAELAIGLAINCDESPEFFNELFARELPDANMLPFIAILTSEGTWVDGFSSYKDEKQLAAFLETANKSKRFDATPEAQKQLATISKAATTGLTKNNWKLVHQAVKQSKQVFGRCPERAPLRAAGQQLQTWLKNKFDSVVNDAVSGAKLIAAKKHLLAVQRVYKGDPEEAIAKRGVQAIKALNKLRSAEARANTRPGLREDAANKFRDTPWHAMFAKPTGKKPAKSKPSEPKK